MDNFTGISRRGVLKGVGAVAFTAPLTSLATPSSNAAIASTTIKRVNNGKFSYECINTATNLIEKVQTSTFDYANFRTLKQTPADRAKAGGYAAIINSDSWANVDGSSDYNNLTKLVRPVSLQVLNGKFYQEFNKTYSEYGADSNRLVFAMKNDQKLHHVNNLGLSKVDEQNFLNSGGVKWTAGYGPNLVVNGVKQTLANNNFSNFHNFVYDKVTGKIFPSARTCLGQKSNGTIVIVVVHGRTNEFGATVPDCADIMFTEGCYNAVLLDGGGSSQIYWNGKYIHPSSDKGGVRALGGGFLAIKGSVPNFG